MKKLSLIIYPSTTSVVVKWQAVPRKDEIVFYEGQKHQVSDVWHSMDIGEIKVFLTKAR